VHRNPDLVLTDEDADSAQLRAEIFLPGKFTDRMGGKRDKVGTDAKEPDTMFDIPFYCFFQTYEIALNG